MSGTAVYMYVNKHKLCRVQRWLIFLLEVLQIQNVPASAIHVEKQRNNASRGLRSRTVSMHACIHYIHSWQKKRLVNSRFKQRLLEAPLQTMRMLVYDVYARSRTYSLLTLVAAFELLPQTLTNAAHQPSDPRAVDVQCLRPELP